METLTVYRDWKNAYSQMTTLKTKDGQVKAIINNSLHQPRRGTETIELRGKTYLLDWSKVEPRKVTKK